MRLKTLLIALTCLAGSLWAQTGAHAHHQATYGHPEFKEEQAYDRAQGIDHTTTHILSKNCVLQKQVYGWHPAWSGTAYRQYDYALLTTVAYYSYEVDPATGYPLTTHQWKETDLVDLAHTAGAQVELTASLHGKATAQLLKNPKACKQLCDSLLQLIQFKDADGVCIDFQGLAPESKAPFVAFIQTLAATLRDWRKEATITITLPATNAAGAYDIAGLSPHVDRMIVLAYDVHGSASAVARPVAPLHASKTWGEAGFTNALRQYIDGGAPKNKLLAGVPYYGYRWPVAASGVPAKATGPGTIVPLRQYESMDSAAYLNWDSSSVTGWLPSAPGQPLSQLWIEQVSSLTEKFNHAKTLGIAGVGIWALGYDHGHEKYWSLLRGQFADCPNIDALATDSDTRHPALRGPTSAERNTWNWVWMIGGGAVAVAIIVLVKKYL
jgi:spore germination protein